MFVYVTIKIYVLYIVMEINSFCKHCIVVCTFCCRDLFYVFYLIFFLLREVAFNCELGHLMFDISNLLSVLFHFLLFYLEWILVVQIPMTIEF